MIFRRYSSTCRCTIISIILLTSVYSVDGQNLNLLTPYLGEKDQKAVEDAMGDIKKAGEIVQEANQYYNEALSLQSNYDLDEETLQKKLNSLESKAIGAQLKADKIYRSTNKKVIEICKKTVEAKASTNEEAVKFSTGAEQMILQAEEKRKASEDVKNVYEKATLLNDASGLESAAIDNYISAIAVANNDELPKELSTDDQLVESEIQTEILISLKDTSFQEIGQTTSENLTIDQGMINKYNSYVSDPAIPDPLMVNRSGVTGNAPDDLDGLADYFLNSKSGEMTLVAAAALPPDTAGAAISTKTSYTAAQTGEPLYSESEPSTSEKRKKQDDYSVRTNQLQGEYNIIEDQNDAVRFMIQIASSRIPLTRSQLWAICPGNLSVEVVHENKWYKYRITGLRLFSEANMIAIESGVQSAYVIASLDGQEINLLKAREQTRRFEEEYKKNPSQSVAFKADYFIQVAASRTAIAAEELKNICSEYGNCREIIEEGWFKYQYYGGAKYSEALEISKKLTRKSFIVAYRGGTKINLYKAKKRDK